MTDTEYMKLALELAKKGCGFVALNPMVGVGTILSDDCTSSFM